VSQRAWRIEKSLCRAQVGGSKSFREPGVDGGEALPPLGLAPKAQQQAMQADSRAQLQE
jgi:hypothetical protein